ncbi:DUF3124 domain-containing protein [Thalassoglobus sp. JC818]|uniref:DUF3124 domain-containing protein n=1 Tax=Thalassoglobus sp. JC818 TaxID=3232136 RepID=UPI00345887D2
MPGPKEFPSWFLWLLDRGPLALIAIFVTPVLILLLLGLFLDARIANLDHQQEFRLPSSYTPPDAEQYPVTDDFDGMDSQWVYVPSYSHVYYEGGSPFLLETTLSIRNIDPNRPIAIETVDYFNTDGKHLKTFLKKTIELKPLQTVEFLVERRHSSGGSGANFLVEWVGTSSVDPPLIEAIMVGTAGANAISLSRSGVSISTPDSMPGEAD